MDILIILFLEFLKVGLFSVGGGLATIPYLFKLSDTYNWFSSEQLINMIAISESTPGPIGVNTATYAGYQAYGVIGGVFATLGIYAASLIVISLVSKIYEKFKSNKIVKFAFYGIRPTVAGLVLASAFDIVLGSIFIDRLVFAINLKSLILFCLCIFLLNKYKFHPVFYIAVCGMLGLIISF
ncbi:MAG: chromate transporter [Erysipelotrichaceae bacterium]